MTWISPSPTLFALLGLRWPRRAFIWNRLRHSRVVPQSGLCDMDHGLQEAMLRSSYVQILLTLRSDWPCSSVQNNEEEAQEQTPHSKWNNEGKIDEIGMFRQVRIFQCFWYSRYIACGRVRSYLLEDNLFIS